MKKTQSSVVRTASDALLAKWSAACAGYSAAPRCTDEYYDLLETMMSSATTGYKRQTPLVNAGYAARVASMTFLVDRFVSFHSKNTVSSEADKEINKDKVQVIVLGCGLDVLGLWSHFLFPDCVLVYEVDYPEICVTKRDTLVNSGLLKISSDESNRDCVEGVLTLPQNELLRTSSEQVSASPNYTLLSVDLRDLSSLQGLVSRLDSSVPTLVVSELVLAYLESNRADDLFEFCSSRLCAAPNSAFVVYEPLGAIQEADTNAGMRSVTEGYKQQYGTKFTSKLERGTANRNEQRGYHDNVYHPLGANCAQVARRFRLAGWKSSDACLGGTAAACASKLRTPELFDEHAALALHLCTYSVGCAFSNGTSSHLKRGMCPWSKDFAVSDAVSSATDGISIVPVEIRHQGRVRSLFQETYETLSIEYPAVKKMVTTALKTDLSEKRQTSLEGSNVVSTIGDRYRDWGGVFVVATEKSCGSKADSVVGCVGVRPLGQSEVSTRGLGENGYEIHRLAVDSGSRGKGIGKSLLEAVHRFASLASGRKDSFYLVATTPAVQTAANHLYLSLGFNVEEEVSKGELVMRCYAKKVNLTAK